MFVTIRDRVDVYDQPSLKGKIVGNLANNQQINVTGQVKALEGWIWQEVEGGGLWIIERSADGSKQLLNMIWKGSGRPPIPAELVNLFFPPTQFPPQPNGLTNQDLLTALQQTAQALGAANLLEQWIAQSGLAGLRNAPTSVYAGAQVATFPLEDEIKLTIISKLNAIAAAKESKASPMHPKQGRFSTQGMQFFLDGRPFRFVGANVRELAYYGFSGWEGVAQSAHIDLQLEALKQMRGQVFRIYAPFWRDAQRTDNRTDAREAAKRIKIVLDKAQKLGLFALITLDDAKQSGFNVGVTDWKWRDPGNVYNTSYYYNGYRERYIPFVKEVVGALGGHPAIFAWGICNESQVWPFIPPTPRIADCDAFLNFYKHTSEVIRSLAPNDLITTSVESTRVLFVENAYKGKKYANLLYKLPTIDFATVHSYQDHLRMDNVLGHNDEDGRMELELARTVWKKPVIIEEIGPVGGPGRNGTGWLGNAVAKWFELGAAGVLQWGFSAANSDIGVGDRDAGMHNTPGNPTIPGDDWGGMFEVYKHWGNQFFV